MNNILTERELEVLKLVICGKTNKEIAEELMVSTHTIKAHVSAIMQKLGGRTRVDIAVKALHDGVIQL